MKVLKLLMFNNYISFEGKIYRQLQGTATGTAVAPAFANLYLHFKYKDLLWDNDKIQVQLRFIDDGFMVVDNKEEADKIMRNMNARCNLSFTHDISETSAIFSTSKFTKANDIPNTICSTCGPTSNRLTASCISPPIQIIPNT